MKVIDKFIDWYDIHQESKIFAGVLLEDYNKTVKTKTEFLRYELPDTDWDRKVAKNAVVMAKRKIKEKDLLSWVGRMPGKFFNFTLYSTVVQIEWTK